MFMFGGKHRTGIIILGMHRSGTSLTAEIGHRWGAYVDTNVLREPNDGNPRGYWEHGPLVELNDDLLSMVHSSWKVPPADEVQTYLAGLAQEGRFRRRADSVLAAMNPDQTVWLWKDPRLCILLPFWKQIWGNVIYLVPVRDPMAISSSLCARRDFSTPSALLLWQRYMSTVLLDGDVSRRALFFSYEELLRDTRNMCDHICRFLDQNTGLDDQDREHRLVRMLESVRPELHRHKASFSSATNADENEVVLELYRALMLRCQGVEEAVIRTFPMPAEWRETLRKNAIAGEAGETFHRLRTLLRPAKWKATTLLRQISKLQR